MMDCTQAQEEFAALLDGELAPEERAAVERHLSQCSDCLRDLDGLKRVDTIYRQLPPVGAPEGLEDRVRQAIRPTMVLRFPGLGRERRPLWPALAAAAVFLVVMGAVALRFWMLASESDMTMASLEKGVAAPAPEARREVAAPQAAMDAATPMASPPRAGVLAEIAAAPPAAAEAPAPPQETALMAQPESPVPDKGVKSKAAAPDSEREAFPSRANEAHAAPPPAQEVAPSHDLFMEQSTMEEAGQTFGAAAAPLASAATEMPAAPPAAPAPTEADDSASVAQSAPPQPDVLVLPKVMAEAPAAKAEAKEEPPRTEEIGKRTFEQRNGVWYETGYKDQEATRLVRGSADLRKLVSAHADLGKVLELGERVVFKVDGKWYRVDPRAGR